MSAATPTASTPDASTPAPASAETNQATQSADRLVLEYLRARGHKFAEQALTDAIGSSDDKGKSPVSISGEELVKKLALFAEKPAQPGENTLRSDSQSRHSQMPLVPPTTRESPLSLYLGKNS